MKKKGNHGGLPLQKRSMKYNPSKDHRRSLRLRDYDYTQAGAYFVTIVAQGRRCLFGTIEREETRLNKAGRMVHAVWSELPVYYLGDRD